MSPRARAARVIVAGGGVAAVETLLALRERAGLRTQTTLLAADATFIYQPVAVAEPFGLGEARAYSLDDIVAHCGGELVADRLAGVDPIAHTVRLASGEQVSYDHLVVATGAIPRLPLPGAFLFRGRRDVPAMRTILDALRRGQSRSIVFAAPSRLLWTLPLYELALMTAAYLHARGCDAELWLVTPESAPLEAFGPAAAEAVTPMLGVRSIHLRTGAWPRWLRGGRLGLDGGEQIPADHVVMLPALAGPHIPGLPADADGFVPVDCHGRVPGAPGVFAAGDVTTRTPRQGGLAAQQADAVAEAIAAAAGVIDRAAPYAPVLRGLLMTGAAPLYLRAEADGPGRAAEVAAAPLWWPPSKIAGRYLAPYLATAVPAGRHLTPLADRPQIDDLAAAAQDADEALELALLLADCDARWGDHRAALEALEAAELVHGPLPPEYEAKRRAWQAVRRP